MPIYRVKKPITVTDLPPENALDTEFQAADSAHLSATDPHPQYLLPSEGDARYLEKAPTHIEFGLGATNLIDFHVTPSSSDIDFDVRVTVNNGKNQNGRGDLAIQAALFNLLGKFSVNSGAQLAKLLSAVITLDLPSIPVQGVIDVYVTVTGATVGDCVFFMPLVDFYIGLFAIHISATVSSVNTVRLFFYNPYNTPIDLVSFSGRVIVLGF